MFGRFQLRNDRYAATILALGKSALGTLPNASYGFRLDSNWATGKLTVVNDS